MLTKLAKIGLTVTKTHYEETMAFFQSLYGEDFGSLDFQLEWGNDSVSIVAKGEKVLFLEFGSGIYFNATPHPMATELGHEIGKYPYAIHDPSWGNRKHWYYYKEDGKKQFTRGIQASKGMYIASKTIRESLMSVILEVKTND